MLGQRDCFLGIMLTVFHSPSALGDLAPQSRCHVLHLRVELSEKLGDPRSIIKQIRFLSSVSDTEQLRDLAAQLVGDFSQGIGNQAMTATTIEQFLRSPLGAMRLHGAIDGAIGAGFLVSVVDPQDPKKVAAKFGLFRQSDNSYEFRFFEISVDSRRFGANGLAGILRDSQVPSELKSQVDF